MIICSLLWTLDEISTLILILRPPFEKKCTNLFFLFKACISNRDMWNKYDTLKNCRHQNNFKNLGYNMIMSVISFYACVSLCYMLSCTQTCWHGESQKNNDVTWKLCCTNTHVMKPYHVEHVSSTRVGHTSLVYFWICHMLVCHVHVGMVVYVQHYITIHAGQKHISFTNDSL